MSEVRKVISGEVLVRVLVKFSLCRSPEPEYFFLMLKEAEQRQWLESGREEFTSVTTEKQGENFLEVEQGECRLRGSIASVSEVAGSVGLLYGV